jgi:hypothetical protein
MDAIQEYRHFRYDQDTHSPRPDDIKVRRLGDVAVDKGEEYIRQILLIVEQHEGSAMWAETRADLAATMGEDFTRRHIGEHS